jgi:predicted porin
MQEKTTKLFQGETTVGVLSKTFGKLRLGRALTPLWDNKWVYDPWYDSALMGSLNNYNGDFDSDGLPTTDFSNYSRVSNGVYYSTPNFSGFQAHVLAEIEQAIGADTRAKGVSLNYGNGPFTTMYSYEENHVSDHINYVAGSYKLGVLTVMGSYAQTELARTAEKVQSMHVAATYMVGVDTIRGGYGRIKERDYDKVTIGYNHALSKRTNLYADLYREKLADSRNGVALGINHTF